MPMTAACCAMRFATPEGYGMGETLVTCDLQLEFEAQLASIGARSRADPPPLHEKHAHED